MGGCGLGAIVAGGVPIARTTRRLRPSFSQSSSSILKGRHAYPDPQAIQTLAQLYAEGRGVAQDPLTACALSNLGSGAAVYRHGERDARTIAIQRQVEASLRSPHGAGTPADRGR